MSVSSQQSNGLRPTWFELFYDLVVVAALVSVNDAFLAHPGALTAVTASLAAAALFSVWLLTALVNNRIPGEPPVRLVLMLAQMACLVAAALAVDQQDGLGNDYGLLAFGAALLCGAGMYAWGGGTWWPSPRSDRVTAASMAAAAVVAMAGSLLPDSWVWVVLLASTALAVVPTSLHWSEEDRRHPVASDYLAERMGLFVLIALGLSFGQLVIALSETFSIPDLRFFVLMFVLMFTLWWMYFGLKVPEHPRLRTGRRHIWIGAHYLLLVGIAGLGDVISALSAHEADDPLNNGAAYLGVGLALVLVGFAILVIAIDGLGRKAASLLIGSAVVLLLYGLVVDITDLHDLRVAALISGGLLVLSAVLLAWLRRRATTAPHP